MSALSSHVATTMASCIACQAGAEILQSSLTLLSFSSFVFVALHGLVFNMKFFTVRQHIPTRAYVKVVTIFFFVTWCNNSSIRCNVPFPLFIIFKSASLVASMLLGFLLQRRKYTLKEILAVVVVTVGIVIFTLASYERQAERVTIHEVPGWSRFLPVTPFWIGISLLSLATLLSAYLGICQEQLYAQYGRHTQEAMFFIHFLSIPGFALLGPELIKAVTEANSSAPIAVPVVNMSVPSAWLYLAAIVVLQYFCVQSVFRLTSLTTALNVTMIISLRKFVSLVLSFMLFTNPCNMYHLLGGCFVFIGTVLYTKSLSP